MIPDKAGSNQKKRNLAETRRQTKETERETQKKRERKKKKIPHHRSNGHREEKIIGAHYGGVQRKCRERNPKLKTSRSFLGDRVP